MIRLTRQDLNRLQQLCSDYNKAQPKEWPEGLIGVGPDMRAWVRLQEDAPTKPKKSSEDNGNKQNGKSVKKGE